MPRLWSYEQNSVRTGPVDEAQLLTLLATHQLSADALVCADGKEQWLPANQVPELLAAAARLEATPQPQFTPAHIPAAPLPVPPHANAGPSSTFIGSAILVALLLMALATAIGFALSKRSAQTTAAPEAAASQDNAEPDDSLHLPKNTLAECTALTPEVVLPKLELWEKDLDRRVPPLKAIREAAKHANPAGETFNINDPKEYTARGFDLSKPIQVALLPSDKPDGSPVPLLSLGVTDLTQATASFRAYGLDQGWKAVEQTVDGQLYMQMGPQSVFTIKGRRLFYLIGRANTDGLAVLAKFLKEKDGAQLSDEAYFKTLSRLVPANDLVGYAGLHTLFETIFKDQPAAQDGLEALGLSLGDANLHAFLLLTQDSNWRTLAQSGASFREVLAKLDPPLAAAGVSLADPDAVFTHVLALMGRTRAEFEKENPMPLPGYSYDDIAALLKGGCALFALYNADRELIAVHLNERNSLSRLIEAVGFLNEKTTRGDDFCIKFDAGTVGLYGNYLIYGRAHEQIVALIKRQARGWKPACAGTEPLYAEINLKEFGARFTPVSMPKPPYLKELFSNYDKPLVLKLELHPEGFALKSESPAGVKTLLDLTLGLPQVLGLRAPANADKQ